MQKSVLILKLDTPCTLQKTAMRVPQAEPINFAKAYIDSCDAVGDVCTVSLLGLSAEQEAYGVSGTIRIVPYFGNPKTVQSYVDEHTTIILWQGMHAISVPQPSNPAELEGKPVLMVPYAADCFQRLSLVKSWQIQMYNLAASNVLEQCKDKYFMITDARLPLLELNKIDSVAVPKPLPKHIKMLTQAYCADEFRKWHNKWGNAQHYFECNIADYVYQFEEAAYLPLHSLPLWSHAQFAKPIASKTVDRAIFQVQSLKYMDDYRKSCLKKAIDKIQGKCTLHGRFLAEERAIAKFALGKWGTLLEDYLIDNSDTAECFFDSAKVLSKHIASLTITDARYQRFGLCPNRYVEAIAVGTVPICEHNVLSNCDSLLKGSLDRIDTAVSVTDDAVIKVDDTFDGIAELYRNAFRQQLIDEVGKLVDGALFSKN